MTSESPSDGTLIAAVLAGEPGAFDELVARYQSPLLRAACSRMGRRDWAEDVVQETFLCVFRWLHTYDSRYSFRTWLWTILLNQCHRQFKRFSRGLLANGGEAAADDDCRAALAEQLCRSESPPEQLAVRERAELLDALLRRLPEAQADALRLRFFGGLKFHEIAEAMGCSLSTAKNRVRWGLTKLAEHLGPLDEVPFDCRWESK